MVSASPCEVDAETDLDEAVGQGLSTAQARQALIHDGPNELPQQSRRRDWQLLFEVITQPMVGLLVACGALYLVLGDAHEALMLLAFVLVVIGITLVQKRRSERSLEALRHLSSPRAQVIRDGQAVRVAGRELVRGDVVLLAEGDRVPADLQLIDVNHLSIDESLLTGESLSVSKSTDPGASSMALAGTLVTQGMGRGRVVATGVRSTLGRIGASLGSIQSAPTPVQRETQTWVTGVATLGLGVAAILALGWGLSRGDWLGGLLAGLTLAMAILPEELPVVLTLFLGLGAWRLARQNVLTRNMPAIEALGATTVLCVDKTGTLTMNRMSLRHLWVQGQHLTLGADDAELPQAFQVLVAHALRASHRRAVDPMERAIDTAVQAHPGLRVHAQEDWQWVGDYPLSKDLLAMSRVWRLPDRECHRVAAKGAPEAIMDLCHLSPEQQQSLTQVIDGLAGQGLRVLAVARAHDQSQELPPGQHDFDFEFLGLLGFEDPVRPDVPASIAECRGAGIRVVMITGDHPHTALSIARQIGLRVQDRHLCGSQIDALDDAQLARHLVDTDVFCRVQPQQKLRLVQGFRARGEVVAMTGDGVNDAPALKAAHIGVAMGARGSDVAREAADLVLLKDDFASLVTALREGRRVFANLRKAMSFLVAVHIPIVGLSIAPVLFGGSMILMPVHILFLQLIIDPVCSVVFEAEPLQAGAMRQPPRSPGARLFDRALLVRALIQGGGLFVIVLAAYGVARAVSGSDAVARALAFVVLVLSSLALIQTHRRWAKDPSTPAPRSMIWRSIVWLTPAMLAATLLVPGLSSVFAFETPAPGLLFAGLGLCVMAAIWFESVTRLASRASA
jgi:Ca2+-transporting ATPase